MRLQLIHPFDLYAKLKSMDIGVVVENSQKANREFPEIIFEYPDGMVSLTFSGLVTIEETVYVQTSLVPHFNKELQ